MRSGEARSGDFLLEHKVVFSHRTGELAHPTLLRLRFPAYWHYGLFPGLRALVAAGRIHDARTSDALDLLESARRSDGSWRVDGKQWTAPGSKSGNVEAVSWGSLADELLTEQALGVLAAAGRL